MPRLSIVIAARNDDYGRGFQRRLHCCVEQLLLGFASFGTSAEILIVEWNPDPAAEGIAERLSNLSGSGLVRIVHVPHSVHEQIADGQKINMFEYAAKNTGIRRARGDYVVVINPDIILSTETHRWFATGSLPAQRFVRIDRFDLPSFDLSSLHSREVLGWCQRNWTKRLTYWSTVERHDWKRRALNELAVISLPMRGGGSKHPHFHASGDFMLMKKDHWLKVGGYREERTALHRDSLLVQAALDKGLTQVVLRGSHRIYHQFHEHTDKRSRDEVGLAEVLKRDLAVGGKSPVSDWGLRNITLNESNL